MRLPFWEEMGRVGTGGLALTGLEVEVLTSQLGGGDGIAVGKGEETEPVGRDTGGGAGGTAEEVQGETGETTGLEGGGTVVFGADEGVEGRVGVLIMGVLIGGGNGIGAAAGSGDGEARGKIGGSGRGTWGIAG